MESSWHEIIDCLEKDFSAFKSKDSFEKVDFCLQINQQSVDFIELPTMKPQTSRSFVKSYYKFPILVNDYKSEVRSEINLSLERAHIVSMNIDHAHEVAYLLILSRVGKMMELAGNHKIHGMAFAKNGKVICLSMSSGGGKSTLLQSLISDDHELKVYSDDCPVVNANGQILSFPIRLGVSEKSPFFNHAGIYELRRMRYGLKKLLDIKHVSYCTPGSYSDEMILIFGKRSSVQHPQIKPISKIKAFVLLIKPFLIGVGLPIILEYFWEPSFADFKRRSRIAIFRLRAGIRVCKKAKCYSLEMNDDLEASKQILRELI